MRYIKSLVSLFIIVMLSGCASLDKDACLGNNWESIGYSDGANGRLATRINAHHKACAKYSVVPDMRSYQAGRMQGLVQVFCKPRNGYKIGLRGRNYNNACPARVEANFIAAYHYGKDIYLLEKDAQGLRSTARNMATELHNLDKRIDSINAQIYSGSSQAYAGNGSNESFRSNVALHVHREFNQYKARVKASTQRIAKDLQLNPTQIYALRDLPELAFSRGQHKFNFNYWKNRRGNEKILHKNINTINKQIHNKKKALDFPKRSRPQRSEIQNFIQTASYMGELDAQFTIVKDTKDHQQLNKLVRFHFTNKPSFVIQHANPAISQAAPQNTTHAPRTELKYVQQERDRLLLEKHDIDYQYSSLTQEIQHLKANSPYR